MTNVKRLGITVVVDIQVWYRKLWLINLPLPWLAFSRYNLNFLTGLIT